MPLKAKWIVASGAALLLLLFIGLLSYRRLEQEDAAQRWVSHTHDVMEKLDATLANTLALDPNHQDMETGSQHDSEIIEKLEANLSEIKALTADNAKQQKAIEQLIPLVRARNALQRSIPSPAKAEVVAQSRELLYQIRLVLLRMRQEEERLEGERLQAVQTESRIARIILGIGYAVALLALVLTGVSVFREMVPRMRSEEQLRVAQKQFRLLFDSNPIPVWVYDLETLAIMDVNAIAVSRYGYSREEFVRFKITDIRPPEDVPSLMESVRAEGESADDSGPWRHRKKSGELLTYKFAPIR